MEGERKPYVGPRPFEATDLELFFGREREARDLKSRMIAHPLVLLYAQSGAGKTSLINAGLIPLLVGEGFEVLPPTRVHGFLQVRGPGHKGNIFVSNVLHEVQGTLERNPADASDREESLTSFLDRWPRQDDEAGETKPFVLIVDQFEEIFSVHPDRWRDRRAFFEQIQEALKKIPSLRILLAMREDYLAHLDPYLGIFPDGLRIRMRLELLREQQAIRAVRSPPELGGCIFWPNLNTYSDPI